MLQFSLEKKLHTTEGEMHLALNATINNGEFISIYGPSGVGKTSILRMLAGFMKPEKGFITMDNITWFDNEKKSILTPQQRKIGFVFQDYALFPNMTVQENIAFSVSKSSQKEIVDELLQLVGLQNFKNRKTQTLSGGQQQRVALARALARKPQLLLLDEPLSAIDDTMRQQLQETILALHKKYNLTTILVSHNIDEIVKLSDKIIHLTTNKVQLYNSAPAFLIGIGYLNGFMGNIIAIKENGEADIIVQQSILNINIPANNISGFKKGDLIRIVHNENGNPIIKKLE